jgi:hypothetical protein
LANVECSSQQKSRDASGGAAKHAHSTCVLLCGSSATTGTVPFSMGLPTGQRFCAIR